MKPTKFPFFYRPVGMMLLGISMVIASALVFVFYALFALGSLPFMQSFVDGAPGWLVELILFIITMLFYASWIASPAGVIIFITGLVKQLVVIFRKNKYNT